MTNTRNSRRAGFTLMELMMAMALFSLLSVGLITLLNNTTNLLAQGNSGVATLDALQLFSESFERDAATIYTARDADTGRPDVRMFSDVVSCKYDDTDERAKADVQRLFFVRMIPNEATASLTRQAGSSVGKEATEYLDQENDASEAAEHRLRATGGLMEVLYVAAPSSVDDPAVMTLYRAVRAPIGGAGTLLPVRRAADPSATVDVRGPVSLKEIRAVAEPLLSGVLYFGVQFAGRKTRTWDTTARPPSGPSRTWDSTRGILPGGKGGDSFFMSKVDPSGVTSLDDPVDDVFPRTLLVTLVVEEIGTNARVSSLVDDVSADAKFLNLRSAAFIPTVEGTKRFVKIDNEWIEFLSKDGNRLTGCRRGARGTTAEAHLAGSVVHHGQTLTREIAVATYRDSYQEDIEAVVR